MRKTYLLVLLCMMMGLNATAQKVFDFTPTCEQAYKEITALKIRSGQQLINTARQENPNNLIPELLESYIDFFVLFFNEDPAEYKIRKGNFEKRIDQIEEGPESSPFYLYSKSVIKLHQAVTAIKFGEKWSAAWDFRRAFLYIKDNNKKFPNFIPNKLIYGPLQVAVGTIPKGYKWLGNLFGMKGSVNGGIRTLRTFLNSKDEYARALYNEGAFYYCYVTFYIDNKPEEVFRFIHANKLDVVNNHLFTYVAANLSINNKQVANGERIIQNRARSNEYLQTPVWDFELAYAKLYHLELNEAITEFNKFLTSFKGKFYVKDALQKLSWAYYLKGDIAAAEATRKRLLNSGATDTDADKKAQKDAKTGTWPNTLLLKARLLNDGGYHKEAYALLEGKRSTDFSTIEEQLEFIYRVARIYDELGYDAKAIDAYEDAIRIGINRKEYYASRAALQIGYILEKQGKKAEAIAYYEKCLAMEDHEYKDSIDQRAKSGIARCKGE